MMGMVTDDKLCHRKKHKQRIENMAPDHHIPPPCSAAGDAKRGSESGPEFFGMLTRGWCPPISPYLIDEGRRL